MPLNLIEDHNSRHNGKVGTVFIVGV